MIDNRFLARAGVFAVCLAPVSVLAEYDGCPVTTAAHAPFTNVDAKPFGKHRFLFGDQRLWTWLPESGEWSQLAFGEKVFWWSDGYDWQAEPEPPLVVTARRLDVAMDTVTFDDATNAYHESFGSAMLTGITLPTYGCWEINGTYRGATLTFVVAVAPDRRDGGR